MDKTNEYLEKVCRLAKKSSRDMAIQSKEAKNRTLDRLATLISKKKQEIKKENQKDLDLGENAGLSSAMLDRLTLSDKRVDAILQVLHEVAQRDDPVGSYFGDRNPSNGLRIRKMRVPIGVILMIYESRPNVTIDAAALCLKSGNGVILRGGKEAAHSNIFLTRLFQEALEKENLPEKAVQLIEGSDRSAIDFLVTQRETIDLVIPRGGEGLIHTVVQKSTIPVIKHYKGVCHVYIDGDADFEMAIKIALNAKVQRPGVCNAMETLLIDKTVPSNVVKDLIQKYVDHKVELVGDPTICLLDARVQPATTADWDAEYLDYKLAMCLVDGCDGAIDHIFKYGSGHTEAIVTENKERAQAFLRNVDSSSVMVNASTRFSDGGEYGLGAEIGISTDKLHARGPMGLEELTTYKWIVEGEGQIRT